MEKFSKSIFIFRRDLRTYDNTGLIRACKNSKQVIPCFIFDKNILDKKFLKNSFRFNFFLESIKELQDDFKKKKSKLHLFLGNPNQIISRLIKNLKAKAVLVNLDYTPYSRKRDELIEKVAKKEDASFISVPDQMLHNVGLVKTNEGNPYTIFTQYFKKARNYPIQKPQKFSLKNCDSGKINGEITLDSIQNSFLQKNIKSVFRGGRKEGLKILKKIQEYADYDDKRNYPFLDATTHLSPHNRFGTVSIREVHKNILEKLGHDHGLIAQLFWRDFFTQIMYYFPHSFSNSFQKKYSKYPWSKDSSLFRKWCEGNTGFPIVDAGMRELNSTGYMHNRVRMIVASFLTKDLHIDWKLGERYFAEKLVDYDPSVNIGNWQWAASTGCDSQPWFRIFNPWLQQKRFDPDCNYIKKWIPELSELNTDDIHNWNERTHQENIYPIPIVEHSEEASHTKELFQKISLKARK